MIHLQSIWILLLLAMACKPSATDHRTPNQEAESKKRLASLLQNSQDTVTTIEYIQSPADTVVLTSVKTDVQTVTMTSIQTKTLTHLITSDNSISGTGTGTGTGTGANTATQEADPSFKININPQTYGFGSHHICAILHNEKSTYSFVTYSFNDPIVVTSKTLMTDTTNTSSSVDLEFKASELKDEVEIFLLFQSEFQTCSFTKGSSSSKNKFKFQLSYTFYFNKTDIISNPTRTFGVDNPMQLAEFNLTTVPPNALYPTQPIDAAPSQDICVQTFMKNGKIEISDTMDKAAHFKTTSNSSRKLYLDKDETSMYFDIGHTCKEFSLLNYSSYYYFIIEAVNNDFYFISTKLKFSQTNTFPACLRFYKHKKTGDDADFLRMITELEAETNAERYIFLPWDTTVTSISTSLPKLGLHITQNRDCYDDFDDTLLNIIRKPDLELTPELNL